MGVYVVGVNVKGECRNSKKNMVFPTYVCAHMLNYHM